MPIRELDRLAQVVVERAAALALYARQWVDSAWAEDVVQEALTALLAERRPPRDPVAWMYRAVRNTAIDYARAASRRRSREQLVAQQRCEWFEPRPGSLIDADVAERALRQLPGESREVVVLRIWGDLGLAQIAAIMQVSVSTVHERLACALEQLRSVLEQPCRSKMD